MGAIEIGDLPEQALLLLDTAPVIYCLEGHPKLAARFAPIFDAHAEGRILFAATTITVCEVLTGPMKARDISMVRHCRAIFDTWQIVELDSEIAESAARLRASLGLRLPDAVQVSSALAIKAAALVTHDRDFSRVKTLRILS
jgi:predicted nucleic acid-binding protein